MVPLCAALMLSSIGYDSPQGLLEEWEAFRAVVQIHIGPKMALAICCLLNLPCEMGQWFQPSQQRGVERLSHKGFGIKTGNWPYRFMWEGACCMCMGEACTWPLLSWSLGK